MNNPRGRVIAISEASSEPSAKVEVTALRCARCASGKGCGAGLLGSSTKDQCIDARIAAGITLCEGDEVRVELAPSNVLQAALIVYGMPLCGAVAGAGVSYFAGLQDLAAALAAIAGIAAGIGVARYRLRASRCLRQFTPTVVERLSVGH